MKKIFLLFTFVLSFSLNGLFAQQITKFAVVDTARVYQSYYSDSKAVRDYENKKAAFQSQIDSLTQELKDLNAQKVEYERSGRSLEASNVQEQINSKKRYVTEYTRSKNAELAEIKKSLKADDAFYQKLYAILEDVAEREGYSMVLSVQQNNAILWYSDSVDITDKIIEKLK